ncbi:MAG TPA: hypothetical protein VFB32_13005 [Rudaea sp.]|jgi:hypothetical protein|nr:hypothetical protein [Rudaea sp.]
MMHGLARSRFAPWAGFVAGPLGWALHQQLLADMLHFDCRLGGAVPGLVAGLCLAGVLVASASVSWRARDAEPARSLRHFVGTLSAATAAVFLFAIALQTLASVILPGCGA